jgi:hypothetical protein
MEQEEDEDHRHIHYRPRITALFYLGFSRPKYMLREVLPHPPTPFN